MGVRHTATMLEHVVFAIVSDRVQRYPFPVLIAAIRRFLSEEIEALREKRCPICGRRFLTLYALRGHLKRSRTCAPLWYQRLNRLADWLWSLGIKHDDHVIRSKTLGVRASTPEDLIEKVSAVCSPW